MASLTVTRPGRRFDQQRPPGIGAKLPWSSLAPADPETGDDLVSTQQQHQLDAILRQGQFDPGADVQTLRAAFSELMAQVPVPSDMQQNPVEIGGVAGLEVTIDGIESKNVILYFHGGVYVIGSAASTVPLVGDLVRRTGTKAITLDYRLAVRGQDVGDAGFES
jgi:acetyl esterase/lipase